ncbi:MAG TPA: hypothetical protein VLA78_06420 [Paracoccaceae bacterium]|nr:hypothetical protein [Paracoccaceae bacterium]
MKTREDSAARLMLEDRPVVMGAVMAAMVLLFAGGGVVMLGQDTGLGLALLGGAAFWGLILAVFVRRTLLILDAPSGLVVLRVASVTGQTERTWPLAALRGAEVESMRSTTSGKKASMTYRCVLTFDDPPGARVPVTEAYSGGQGAAQAAGSVNGWLSRPQA